MTREEMFRMTGKLKEQLNSVILGKEDAVELLLTALFAGGHALLEDVPGTGKTMLAKALALSVKADFKRVQFTPDLLPADILGTSVYSPKTGLFEFRPGPVFTNLFLADEINRASPRTQSALLESMNEFQVSVEGKVMPLSFPFMVIATENPIEYYGTYPLPEAQLDRFAVRFSLGYPDESLEMKMMRERRNAEPADSLAPVMECADILAIQEDVQKVVMEDSVASYMHKIILGTRSDPAVMLGASPRALLIYARCVRACAWLAGRDYVLPEDAVKMAVPVLAHRLVLTAESRNSGIHAGEIVENIVKSFPVPV